MVFAGINMSNNITKNIIRNLLNASFTKFYNRVLTGRIMNRLSKDIYSIDATLTDLITLMFEVFFLFFQTVLIFIALQAYITLPGLFVFSLIVVKFSIMFVRSLRETTRIEAISKSPILSFMSEIIRGAVYSRSCLNSDLIYIRHQNNQDIELRNKITTAGIINWYSLTMGLFATVFVVVTVFVMKFSGEEGENLTFALVSAINLGSSFIVMSITYVSLEINMVYFERCHNLAY